MSTPIHFRTLGKSFAVQLQLFILGLWLGSLQLLACPVGSVKTNASYQPSQSGEFCRFDNHSSVLRLADPSVVKIDGAFFITGTTDALRTGNFQIYRTEDFKSFQNWMTAFPDQHRSAEILRLPNQRNFCNLWAPELYLDPKDPHHVYLTFTATEDRSSNLEKCRNRNLNQFDFGLSLLSVYTTRIPKAQLLQRTGHFNQNISWYVYQVANQETAFFADGGARAQSFIPTTGNSMGPNWNFGLNAGQNIWSTLSNHQGFWGGYACHRSTGCSTWMRLDSHVFFDPNDNDRPWMFYTWTGFADPQWRGNHIAAYPLRSENGKRQFVMDDSGNFDILPMAYRFNTKRRHNGHADGCMGKDGPNPSGYCVAEAPSVFYRAPFYYLLFSRNAWDSSAYSIVWKKARSIEGLALTHFNQFNDQAEQLLVQSPQPTEVGAVSYGHPSVFEYTPGRWMMAFHRKRPGGTFREVFFKELKFDAHGNIIPFQTESTPILQNNPRFFQVEKSLIQNSN